MIHWKPEGRKKNEAVPGDPGKMEYILRRMKEI
jgi:hypothetical protein